MSGLGRRPAVLIVEDNERNMKLARDVLQFHGFRTLETVNGEDAGHGQGEQARPHPHGHLAPRH